MGRPLNKKNFGQGGGALAVRAYRRRGETEVDGSQTEPFYVTDVWIKRQASTRDFVLTNGTWEERLTLCNFDPDNLGEFGTLEEGTFALEMYTNTFRQAGEIAKLTQNKFTWVDRGENIGTVWSNNENLIEVTDITAADPGVVTAPGHGLEDGDYIQFLGDFGMSEIYELPLEVTVIDADSFSIGDTSGNTAFDGVAYGAKIDYSEVYDAPAFIWVRS